MSRTWRRNSAGLVLLFDPNFDTYLVLPKCLMLLWIMITVIMERGHSDIRGTEK